MCKVSKAVYFKIKETFKRSVLFGQNGINNLLLLGYTK